MAQDRYGRDYSGERYRDEDESRRYGRNQERGYGREMSGHDYDAGRTYEDRGGGRDRSFMVGEGRPRTYGNERGDMGRGSFEQSLGGHSQSHGGDREPGQDHHGENYRAWREQQMSQFDRDYEEYRRERQSAFDSEFDAWRKNRRGGAGSGAEGAAGDGGSSGSAGAGSGIGTKLRTGSADRTK